MEPVDLVPRGYRFLPSAEELVIDYLGNWVVGTPLPGRAVAFADVYGTEPWNLLGSERQEGYFFAERKPKSSGGSRVDRKAGSGSWILNKRQESVKSIIDGREMVVGRKSSLSFNDGRRKNCGWTMYEYEMSSSVFERRVLCHVKKNSHGAISGGGTTIKTIESTFTEAATETVTGGSLVGQKRNREEASSTLSAAPPSLWKKSCRGLVAHTSGAVQSDVSPPPAAVVQQQQPLWAPVVTPTESRFSSVESVAPKEAGVPVAWPSSTDVGGDELVTTGEAFFRRCEQMSDGTGTDDQFFTSLEPVDAFWMPDDTFAASTTIPGASLSSSTGLGLATELQMDNARSTTPKELQASVMSDGNGTDSTTVEAASSSSSSSSSNDSVGCEQTENLDLQQWIEELMK